MPSTATTSMPVQPRRRGRPPKAASERAPTTRPAKAPLVKLTEAQIDMQREELTALASNYARLMDITPDNCGRDVRSVGSFTRMIVSDVLGMKTERVRDWFYRHPVPELALIAMRQAIEIERLKRRVAGLPDEDFEDAIAAE